MFIFYLRFELCFFFFNLFVLIIFEINTYHILIKTLRIQLKKSLFNKNY